MMTDNITFYSFEASDFRLRDAKNDPYLKNVLLIAFFEDQEVTTFSRQVYTVSLLLANIGGFASVIMAAGAAVTKGF